ncbi:MAG: hypothetical protein V3V57_15220 [Spirochaetia bacterium]
MIDLSVSRISSVFVFLILAVLPSFPQDSSVRYYTSNDLGMALEEIGWYRRDEFPYLLVVQKGDQWEKRTLLHRGEEIRRWEVGAQEERVFDGGVIQERFRYDQSGRLTEEQLFQDGEPSRRKVYHYRGAVLALTETFDSKGELLFRDAYYLSPGGELRRVSREERERQTTQELALSGGGGILAEERYGNVRDRKVSRYDLEGRLTERERWSQGELIERERFEYRGDGDALVRSQLEQLQLRRTIRRSYDEQGRLIRSVVEQEGDEIEQTVHLRDETGAIVETTKRSVRGLEHWLFDYGPQDTLRREEYRIRGALERITIYSTDSGESSRTEELYREGQIFMRIYFEGEEKVKEEFLRNGEVIRERQLQ